MKRLISFILITVMMLGVLVGCETTPKQVGVTTEKGLITPKFGNKPENHVAVSMTLNAFGELLLATQAHYQAWLTAWYMGGCKTVQPKTYNQKPQTQNAQFQNPAQSAPAAPAQPSFIPDASLGIGTMSDEEDLPF